MSFLLSHPLSTLHGVNKTEQTHFAKMMLNQKFQFLENGMTVLLPASSSLQAQAVACGCGQCTADRTRIYVI